MAGNEDAQKTQGQGPRGSPLRRNFPYNPYVMAAAGLAVVGGIWYMYNKRSPEDRPRQAA
ncbi:hypothetical protein CDL12_27253 [Handroanthus impetiginosus]|uniref:Uncharacterized protein n=1 Tax=Handroanthus impetiginosus TaxID=429701 RepID=A0A2G9G528_9LAMI|nr:hypothetical protein CDL12_27253 [Handroanthus impetiginosus]